MLCFIPNHLKTQEMCKKAVEKNLWALEDVPDHFKTKKMCEKAVKDDDCDDDELIDWCNGHQKPKTQKAKFKEELLPVAQHPSRWWDWCVPEDEKEETEKLWAQIWAFLCLVTGYKKPFDQKELQKMSSIVPFSFNAVELYIVTINEKPWTRARELCWIFQYGKATKSSDIVKDLCSRENYAIKWQLAKFVSKTKFMD